MKLPTCDMPVKSYKSLAPASGRERTELAKEMIDHPFALSWEEQAYMEKLEDRIGNKCLGT